MDLYRWIMLVAVVGLVVAVWQLERALHHVDSAMQKYLGNHTIKISELQRDYRTLQEYQKAMLKMAKNRDSILADRKEDTQ